MKELEKLYSSKIKEVDLKNLIKETFNEMESTDGISPTRDFTLTTGSGGKKDFEHAMWLSNALDYVDFLVEKESLKEHEGLTIKAMLNSNDKENVELGGMIINTKRKEYEINI